MTHISTQLKNQFLQFLKDDCGATAIEYGILASILGLGIVGGSSILGVEYKNLWACMNSSFSSLDKAC